MSNILLQANAIVHTIGLRYAAFKTADTVKIIDDKLIPEGSEGYAIVIVTLESTYVKIMVPLPEHRYSLYIDVPASAIRRIHASVYKSHISHY